jgi:diguanylate cyclase (GGDEF)-like protein
MSLVKLFGFQNRVKKNSELERKINVLLAIYLMTIGNLLVTVLLGVFEGRLVSSLEDFSLICFFVLNLIYLRKSLNYDIAALSGVIVAALFIWHVTRGDLPQHTVFFLYAYPVGTAFIVGFRKGLLLSALLLIGVVGNMLYHFLFTPESFYTAQVVVRVIISYLLVTFFSFTLEYLRAESQHRLENTNRQLEALSLKDPLTSLYNRRFFDMTMEREERSYRRRKRAFTLLLLDIDYFKEYNEQFGCDMADRSLVRIGEALSKSASRATDYICRYARDEFAVILTETELKGAQRVAEVIQKNLHYLGIENGQRGRLTASIGIVEMGTFGITNSASILKAADQALKQAKTDGRDRFVVYSEPEPS